MNRARYDFLVKFDPATETNEDLTKKILYTLFIKRIKANKPVVTFVGGESGEGKSLSVIRLQELLMDIQGVPIREYFDAMNVYTPIQYPEKIDAILFDPKYKKANIICMHEAREVVKAKLWHSFVTQAVSDVNAMSRSIKRLCVFIISQFIRDITSDVRYTLTYYIIVKRGLTGHARLYINRIWKDDSDLEKPKLKKRKISGFIILPNGKFKKYVPEHLELHMPDKELVKEFEEKDYEAKSYIIKNKLNRLLQEMRIDMGKETKKIDAMVDWYTKNPESMHLIGRRARGGKWKLKPEAQTMHDLSKEEMVRFEKKINDRYKEIGLVAETEEKIVEGDTLG